MSVTTTNKLIVAIETETPPSLTDHNESISLFFSSHRILDRTAVFFLQLLTNSSTTDILRNKVTFKFYQEGNFSGKTYLDELSRGLVDVYPYPLAIETKEPERLYVTSAVDFVYFYFYANIMTSKMSEYESPETFLTAPFYWSTWVLVALVVIILLAMYKTFSKFDINCLVSLRMYQLLTFFALATFAALYTSALKAGVIHTKPTQPFRDLYELSTKIEKREYSIIVNRKDSLRYSLLTDKNLFVNRTQPMWRLLEAVTKTTGSVKIINEGPEICNALMKGTDTLFLAFESMIVELCPDLNLWKYQVEEYAPTIRTILLAKHTYLGEIGDLFGIATLTYREKLIDEYRKRKTDDKLFNCEMKLIGFSSIKGAFYFISICWGVAISVYGLEILWKKSHAIPV